MSSIVVKKDLTFEELESVLSSIHKNKQNIKLRIPASLKFSGGLGIEIGLIQIIITCFRLSKTNILHTYYEDGKTYLEKFNSQLFGICALTMANSITDTKGNKLTKAFSLKSAIPIIESMDQSEFDKTSKGPEVNLVSISGAQKEYISSLYNLGSKDKLKSSLELKIEIEHIFNYLVGFTSNKQSIRDKMTNKALENISLLVHELFKNTEDHAKTDFTGDQYLRTISGVKFAFPEYDEKKLFKVFDSEVKEYSVFLSESFTINDKIRIFEISIFDSGPGYARRWIGKNFDEFSIDEEKIAFKNCLKKHTTTKSTPAVGMGLTIVRKMLENLNGYIRIRSGRLCFDEFSINNSKKSNFNKKEIEQVEGTSISICIPF